MSPQDLATSVAQMQAVFLKIKALSDDSGVADSNYAARLRDIFQTQA